MEARDTHDELKDAPVLRSIPKVSPFVVPDAFFERFPSAVQSRITTRPGVLMVLREWIARSTVAARVAGIAAVAAVIMAVVFMGKRRDTPTNTTAIAEATIAPTELDLDAIDENDLYVLLDERSVTFTEVGDGLSHDEMAAYLEHEELPLDLLIEQL